MRSPRLPPLDTSEYISCPIDTPLFDFDQKSPLPCIIVTPSSPTEYHIAFHHKASPLKQLSFSAQQQQPRARRALLTSLNPFVASPPPYDDAPPRRLPLKPRTRTALVLAVPIFIIACHLLASSLLRGAGFGSAVFGGRVPHGGFSGAAAHMRAQRDAYPQPLPQPLPLPVPVPDTHPLSQPATPHPLAQPTLD